MVVRIGQGSKVDRDAFDAEFQAALTAHAENPTAETQSELVRLYEKGTQYKGGCGACRNGRNMVVRGLAAMASGDTEAGRAQIRGGFAAVGFKADRLKKFFGF